MEVLPVNLDEMELQEEKPFGEMGIKCYKMPDATPGSYRAFFADGGYRDVEAKNASHAYHQIGRSDVERIVNVRFAYSEMLDGDVLQPTGEEVKPAIAVDGEDVQLVAEFADSTYGTFDMMNLNDYAASFKKSETS